MLGTVTKHTIHLIWKGERRAGRRLRARGRKKEERKLKGMEDEGGRRVWMKVDTWD